MARTDIRAAGVPSRRVTRPTTATGWFSSAFFCHHASHSASAADGAAGGAFDAADPRGGAAISVGSFADSPPGACGPRVGGSAGATRSSVRRSSSHAAATSAPRNSHGTQRRI